MSDKESSTLGSYITSAQATAQSALGSLTGSTADKAQADAKHADAQAEHEASHTAARLGGVTASSSGAIVADNPDRAEGSWNESVGSAKQALGSALGIESLRSSGAQQSADGQAQQAQGQASDLIEGVKDRVTGTVGGAIAALKGDRETQLKMQEQHDIGKTRQRGVELDLQSKADARP